VDKWIKFVNELVEKYGFDPAQRRGQRLYVVHRENKRKVFLNYTQPTDRRAIMNLETTLRHVAALPPLRPNERDDAK